MSTEATTSPIAPPRLDIIFDQNSAEYRAAHLQITNFPYKKSTEKLMSSNEMSRLLAFSVFVLTLISFSAAAPTDEPSLFIQILKDHKDFLPSEVVEAYKGLTPDEKAALKDVFKNYKKYKTEPELIAALKEKSPALGEKAEKLQEKLQKKVDGLSEKPKKFVEELIAAGRGLYARSVSGEKIERSDIKVLIGGQVKAYKALPAEAQDELKANFSGVAKFLSDDKAQALLATLLEKESKD